MPVRGIRGATVVEADEPELILAETRALLEDVVRANQLRVDDIVSVILTTTPDLASEYPARAARLLGWHDTALLGAVEMGVPHGLPRCIRVLLHVNTTKPQHAMHHVYRGKAAELRPDM
jgi:chorismate mutase